MPFVRKHVNPDGRKHGGDCFSDPTWPGKQGGTNTTSGKGQNPDGRKGSYGGKDGWFGDNKTSPGRATSSRSRARKAASAHIAKIPLPLSRHIAKSWHPRGK